MLAIQLHPIRALRPLVPDVNPTLETAVNACLVRDPAKRASSAGEVLAMLGTKSVLNEKTEVGPPPSFEEGPQISVRKKIPSGL